MSDSLNMLRQRERPGYFVQPTAPPRDITTLSDVELDEFLRGFYFNPRIGGPSVSPYSAQDLRLEQARRQPATRRNAGFELEDGSNKLPPPPVTPPTAAAASAAQPSNTNAPARTPAASRQPATDLDRLRATAALDPNFSDQGSIYGPPLPAGQQQQPAQSSVLDMLRKRMARDIEGEALRRASEFGAGMLASGSPNFFAMLGAGARAAREGDASRMDQLRRLADLERQDAAQRAEEARRQEELRIREQEQQLNAPLRAAQTEQALANAAFLRSGRGRDELTRADISRIGAQAEAHALRQVREPTPGSPEAIGDTPAKARERQELREQIRRAYIQERYALLGMELPPGLLDAPGAGAAGGGGSGGTPAAVVDLRTNPGGNPSR